MDLFHAKRRGLADPSEAGDAKRQAAGQQAKLVGGGSAPL